MIADLKYAFRQFFKTPGFTATALLTLALCLGATLSIFAVIQSVLLRPLPFPNADQLVTIFNTYPKAGVERDGSSITNYYERRGSIPAFSSLSIFSYDTGVVGDSGSTQQEEIVRVSPEFFATLGVGPVMGRGFTEEEAAVAENNGVAIITDAYWRQHLNADAHVLGRDIRVNTMPRKVVGVLPPDFRFLSSEARIYLPIRTRPEQRMPQARHSGGGGTHMIARLKAGTAIAEAQSQIDAHNAAVEKDNPDARMMAEAGFRSPVVSLHADHVRSIRPTLLLMQGGVFFLLLIGAVNLVNLLLIRASGRSKEMAIRRSMGASRAQIVKQVMIETVLLTFVGGVLGLLVAAWGVSLVEMLGADRLPLGAQIGFDGWLAATGLVGAIVLGIVIAFPIAWFNLSSHLGDALQSESRSGTINRGAQRLRHGFIVAQIALAFVLLTGAALLGVSLKKVMEVSPGFRADHVLTGEFTVPYIYEARPILDRLLESIAEQPGVGAAGAITNVPLSRHSPKSAVTPKGYVAPPGQPPQGHYFHQVTGNYFSALGIALREGRFLASADSQRGERVCVVDEDFARRYWPEGGALGQRVFQGSDSDDAKLFTIVGVVGAVKQAELTEPQGQGAVYTPFIGSSGLNIFVVTRTSQQPEAFAETLRKLVREANPDLAVDNIRSMEARVADSLVARRSPAMLAGIFAAVALVLAAVGTYGVLSYAVAQRRREIGIRMALGARREQIGRQFLLLGARLLVAGTAIGLLGAMLAGRAMRSILFDVPPLHGATFALTTLVMAAVSLCACLLPARRAASVDPMVALRAD